MVWCKARSAWSLKKVLSVSDWVCSLELRELEAKLKAAYTNKERAAQLAEKDALKFDEMVQSVLSLCLYPNSNTGCHIFLRI